ncbi:MAG TPA: hypothetical protein VI489_06010 [Candidatus Brocadiaceae bacterium]
MKSAQELKEESKSKRLSQLDKIYKQMEVAASKGDFKIYWYDAITVEEKEALESSGYAVSIWHDQRDGYTNTISWG